MGVEREDREWDKRGLGKRREEGAERQTEWIGRRVDNFEKKFQGGHTSNGKVGVCLDLSC